MMRLLLLLLLATASAAADRYHVTLRLPPDGLFAREEMQIEFRVEDTTRPDPLGGFVAVIRAVPEAAIDMPAMPGMPKFTEIAHPEGVPGEYGIHPTFAHGGDFRLKLLIHPPGGEAFEATFPLPVQDAVARRKTAPPRYSLELTTEPKRPKAGDDVELRLVVRDRDAAGAPVPVFETVHEAPMHLVIVRRDLTRFAHEHPQLDASSFRLRYRFPTGGEYHLFADVAPRGAGGQVLMAKLKVGGPESGADPAPDSGNSAEITSARDLPARTTTSIVFRIRDPRDLEPYLGAPGHLMLIHEDAESFVHSHPLDEVSPEGELRFMARLPKPGAYHGWLQFKKAGKILTVPLEVRARE
jgi:hypothetical protein